MAMEELLKLAVERQASDLHLVVGIPPSLRIDGEIIFTELPALKPAESKELIYSLLNQDRIKRFEEKKELDFSIACQDIGRFRVNVYRERGFVESSFRAISLKVKNLEELGLPPVVQELALRPSGLVLISGPAGMGKTNTMAAMVNYINENRRSRIITIEDPIEFMHTHKKSIVIQREVGSDMGSDTKSFSAALVSALREDPNVICIGEMRDLDTFSIALTAAETGHLVLGTIHTPNTIQTISRIIDVFPPNQQQQIRIQLASCLEGVISQLLLPRCCGSGRALATEVLISTRAVRNIIRENKMEVVLSVLQTGLEHGMHTMDSSLRDLYDAGVISYDTALSKAQDSRTFKKSNSRRQED